MARSAFPLATIDLGTNAVRFDIYAVRGAVLRRVHRERWPVRLGEKVFETGRLSPAAQRRTIAAFRHFRRYCQSHRITHCLAYGTSALRTARNSRSFLAHLERETAFHVEVISGAKEARLIAEAVLKWEPRARRAAALVDIGGGSVEITLGEKGRVAYSVSLELGVSRLQQLFLKRLPPMRNRRTGRHPIGELRRHLRRALWAGAPPKGWSGGAEIVVSGGTARAVAKLWETRIQALTLRQLNKIFWRLRPRAARALLKLPGIDPNRVDIMLAGTVLLEEIAGLFDAESIAPTNLGLREGMVLEYCRERRFPPPRRLLI